MTGFGLGSTSLYTGLVGYGPFAREGPSGREVKSLKRGRTVLSRRRRTQSALPVGDVRLSSDAERRALCARSNGTCVVPTACQTADVYEEGRLNFHCNLTSVCCLPRYSRLDGFF